MALAAALAVSLLAVSGAGGAGAQEPQRGGTVRFGPFGEPACLNVLLERCSQGGPGLFLLAEKILEPPFFVGPDFTWRPRLVSSVTFTRKPPFTLTYRIHPRARWSDGVPITARDFVFTLRAKIARKAELPEFERPLVERVRSVRRGRLEDGAGGLAQPLRGLARTVREHPAEARASRREPRDGVDRRDRQSQDREADRQRPVSRPALGARPASSRSFGTHVIGERILPTWTGSSSGFSSEVTTRSSGSAKTSSMSASDFFPLTSRSSGRSPASESSPSPPPGSSTSRSGSGRAAIPRSGTSSSGEHLPTASTAPSWCGACSAPSLPTFVPSKASCSGSRARATGRTGAATAAGPPKRAGCSRRPAAGGARTASTPVRGSGFRCVS